jgi:hypothetical protein
MYEPVESAAIARWISPLMEPDVITTEPGALLVKITMFAPVESTPVASVSVPFT